jgi:hypothetical protein
MLNLSKHLLSLWALPLALACMLPLWGCSGPSNNGQAEIRMVAGKPAVLLKGRRLLMSHDLMAALFNKTYADSLLLPLPQAADGVVLGQDIPHEPGQYAYQGEIRRENSQLIVDLQYINTDDHRKDEVSWNGKYELVTP